ncbi:MAG: hypothetical protein ACRECZ_07565 [Methylocella sp.]
MPAANFAAAVVDQPEALAPRLARRKLPEPTESQLSRDCRPDPLDVEGAAAP